ncbi:methyltransferase [Streptomyces sp. NPDC048291]|uniref:methyltransferase n=1 Tax=Streptomyces sp. NPDC048291 TaxID=3365530 RepID=UPI00371E47CC
MLKRITHDWEDEQCVTLLERCRAAPAPGGRILVVDAVVPPGNGPHQAKALDLLLMACLVGREPHRGGVRDPVRVRRPEAVEGRADADRALGGGGGGRLSPQPEPAT